jgi:hypothetical protein
VFTGRPVDLASRGFRQGGGVGVLAIAALAVQQSPDERARPGGPQHGAGRPRTHLDRPPELTSEQFFAVSKAWPMAFALSLNSSIWPKIPDIVLCMVSIIVRIDSMLSIIGGNSEIICGISESS